jgi:hypothetical protein
MELADHLCLQCFFAQDVCLLVANWLDGMVQQPERTATLEDWWNSSLMNTSGLIKKQKASIMIYTTWNI